MKFSFTSLRVFTPLLMCYATLMCYNTGLTAQPADPPNDPPDHIGIGQPGDCARAHLRSARSDAKVSLLFQRNGGPDAMDRLRSTCRVGPVSEIAGCLGNGADSFSVRMANVFGLSFLRQNIAFGVRAFDREDPRYFRKVKGTGRERTKYCLYSHVHGSERRWGMDAGLQPLGGRLCDAVPGTNLEAGEIRHRPGISRRFRGRRDRLRIEPLAGVLAGPQEESLERFEALPSNGAVVEAGVALEPLPPQVDPQDIVVPGVGLEPTLPLPGKGF